MLHLAMQVRTFLAIELPIKIKQALNSLQQDLQTRIPGDIRWTFGEQLHLTVYFIGTISSEKMELVCSILNDAVPLQGRFDLSISRVGYFSRLGRPSVIWVGIIDISKGLQALHETIGKELEKAGISAEKRKFSPHLTIGRVRSITKDSLPLFKNQLSAFEMRGSPSWKVSELLFLRSNLSSTGSKYSLLERFSLR